MGVEELTPRGRAERLRAQELTSLRRLHHRSEAEAVQDNCRGQIPKAAPGMSPWMFMPV